MELRFICDCCNCVGSFPGFLDGNPALKMRYSGLRVISFRRSETSVPKLTILQESKHENSICLLERIAGAIFKCCKLNQNARRCSNSDQKYQLILLYLFCYLNTRSITIPITITLCKISTLSNSCVSLCKWPYKEMLFKESRGFAGYIHSADFLYNAACFSKQFRKKNTRVRLHKQGYRHLHRQQYFLTDDK